MSPTRNRLVLDSVLAAQLRAMGCGFGLTYSPHKGALLHLDAPAQFWTQPLRLLDLVRAVYQTATFSVADYEDDVLTIALEGVS